MTRAADRASATPAVHTATRGRAGGSGPGRRVVDTTAWRAVAIGGLLALAADAAQAVSFSGALPAAASAGVVLAVDCVDSGSGAPASLVVQVADLAPVAAPGVSAQIRRGNAATNTTDAVDADGLASAAVFLDGGAGRYDVFVDKTDAGAESFELTAQCFTGAGGSGTAAGTSITATGGGSVPASSFVGSALLASVLVIASRRLLVTARAAS